MIPLNLKEVWRVISAGPTTPQKMWKSSHRLVEPRRTGARKFFG